jgi:hypothetical protein
VQTGVAHPLRNAKGGAFDFVSVLILEVAVGCRTLWFLRVRFLIFIAGEISRQYKAWDAGIARLQFYLQ